MKILPVNLNSAELFEMVGHELRVQKPESPMLEPGHEIDEGDLARIPGRGEHAFTEESTAEMNPVKAPDQFPILPGLDGVAVSELK